MSFQCGKILEKTTDAELSNELSGEGFFIDDFSHLRLSYYQRREISFEGMTEYEEFEDSKFISISDTSGNENVTTATTLTEISDFKEDERQKMRKLYISQIPDLPHPSFTVASIIATASYKMDSGTSYFKYKDRIEEGRTPGTQTEELKFCPTRRSTLKPN